MLFAYRGEKFGLTLIESSPDEVTNRLPKDVPSSPPIQSVVYIPHYPGLVYFGVEDRPPRDRSASGAVDLA